MSGETRPYDRHTQGTYWYMRLDTLAQGHARARTRSRTHGVEAAQMRLRCWPGPCLHTGPAHSRDQMSEDMLAYRSSRTFVPDLISDLRPAEARR